MPAVTRFLAGAASSLARRASAAAASSKLPRRMLISPRSASAPTWSGIEHRHVLERLERAVLVAPLAQDARLLPEELLDLGRLVGDLEAARDEREELLVVLSRAHAAKELVERDGARRVAREARLERALAGGLVSRARATGAPPPPRTRRARVASLHRAPELARRRGPEAASSPVRSAHARRPSQAARSSGRALRCLLERRARAVEVATATRSDQPGRASVASIAASSPRTPSISRERRRAASRIAAGRRELEVREAHGGRLAGDERAPASSGSMRAARSAALASIASRASPESDSADAEARGALLAGLLRAPSRRRATRAPPGGRRRRRTSAASRARAPPGPAPRGRGARAPPRRGAAPRGRARPCASMALARRASASPAPPDHASRARAAARPSDPSGVSSSVDERGQRRLRIVAADLDGEALERQDAPVAAGLPRRSRVARAGARRASSARPPTTAQPRTVLRRLGRARRPRPRSLRARPRDRPRASARTPASRRSAAASSRVGRGGRGVATRRAPRRRGRRPRDRGPPRYDATMGSAGVAIGELAEPRSRAASVSPAACARMRRDEREAAREVRIGLERRQLLDARRARGSSVARRVAGALARRPRARAPARLRAGVAPISRSVLAAPSASPARVAQRERARRRARPPRPRSPPAGEQPLGRLFVPGRVARDARERPREAPGGRRRRRRTSRPG